MSKPALLASVFLCLQALPAGAAEVFYDLQLEVNASEHNLFFDPRVEPGNVYTGKFSVDDSVLVPDGLNKPGTLLSFSVSIEDITWGLGDPSSEFRGFRGPGGFDVGSPGFDVIGGVITNLRGGVFGSADIPFIDFSLSPYDPGTGDPACPGFNCGNRPGTFFTVSRLGQFTGTFTVSPHLAPVPEPATWLLGLAGLGLLGVARRSARGAQ